MFFILTSINTFAGVTEWYFKQEGISCDNAIEINPNLIGSDELLTKCYGDNLIASYSLGEPLKGFRSIRKDLELWLFVQNASDKILFQSDQQLSHFQRMQSDLKQNKQNDHVNKLNSDYVLLKALKSKLKALNNLEKICSKWRFWNTIERIQRHEECENSNSDILEQEKAATQNGIENFERANPIFLHPIFNQSLDNPERVVFKTLLNDVLNDSIEELKNKKLKYSEIKKIDLASKKWKEELDNPKIISELVAVNYNPINKLVKTNDGYKAVSLDYGKCFIEQRKLAQDSDRVLKHFAKDVALLLSPFAIKGKITAVVKSAKAVKNLINMRRARGVIVVSEASYIAIDSQELSQAKNRCEELDTMVAVQSTVSSKVTAELNECKELMDTLNTSYALAVLGGTAAVKLSKFDINDIRRARIIHKGKESLLNASGAVQSTIIKQADVIKEQLDNLITDISPQPAYAMAGDISDTGPKEANSYLSVFNKLGLGSRWSKKDSQKVSKSIERHNKKAAKREAKAQKKADKQKKRELAAAARAAEDKTAIVDEDIAKIKCPGDCKTELMRLRPGLIKLLENDYGRRVYKALQKRMKESSFVNMLDTTKQILKDCLKVHHNQLNCNQFQFEALVSFVENPQMRRYTPKYIKRILHSLRENPTEGNLHRSLGIVSKFKHTGQGEILSGKLHDSVILREMKSSPDREIARRGADLEKENFAIKLLQKDGFAVDILPEGKSSRLKTGVQSRFQKLAKEDGLEKTRNPDLILDEEFIADIYSPLTVDTEHAGHIAEGILHKTEGRNFRRTININDPKDLHNYGKRQSNRVVVYVHESPKSIEEVAEEVRQEIIKRSPHHIQEAFMIMKGDKGEVKKISVWP